MKISQTLFNLNIADYIIIATIAISTLISLVRGFVKEFMSLIIWVLGFWIAIKLYGSVAVALEAYIVNSVVRQIVSFAGVFLLVLILGALFNYLLSFIIIKSGLSGTDRLLGTIFGCARGVLLVTIILLLLSATSFVQEVWWKESILIPHLQIIVDWLQTFLPQKMTDIIGAIK